METEKKRRETVEREKEQMLREKEELMLRLQDFEQKTKRAEKGQELMLPALPPQSLRSWFPQRVRQGWLTAKRELVQECCLCLTQPPSPPSTKHPH